MADNGIGMETPLTEQFMKEIEATRRIYLTPQGKGVLALDMLDLMFFDFDLTPEDLPKLNAAKRKLERLGIWRHDNIGRIVEALLSMPYLPPTKEGRKEE